MTSTLTRPSFDQVLMTAAFTIAERGTCSRRKVGAVIADQFGSIIAWGYNGSVRGMEHCAEHSDYQPCMVSEHAERNALFHCARNGISTRGLYLVCTDAPCHGCARAVVQCGITKLTYARDYRMNEGLVLLSAAGIEVTKHDSLR